MSKNLLASQNGDIHIYKFIIIPSNRSELSDRTPERMEAPFAKHRRSETELAAIRLVN